MSSGRKKEERAEGQGPRAKEEEIRAEGRGLRAKEEGQKAPRARYVDREHFLLMDGRCFQHLFIWTFVPDLKDFNALLYLCHDLMTDSYFQVTNQAKLDRIWKLSVSFQNKDKENKKGD